MVRLTPARRYRHCVFPGYVSSDKSGMRGRQQQYDVVCKKSQGEITIIQDADLEYAPEEISDIIWPIVQHQADVVYGSRFRVKKAAASSIFTIISRISC